MGIITDAVTEVVKGVASDAARDAALGALVAVEKGVERIDETVTTFRDSRNMSNLKKLAKKQDYCLIVTRESSLGNGVYKVTTKRTEEKYNTLVSEDNNTGIILHLYQANKGEIAGLQILEDKNKLKGILSISKKQSYYVYRDGTLLGKLLYAEEGKQIIYKTDFNDWHITGEFNKSNYKVFEKTTGTTLATISKKYKKASSFIIDCNYDKNEAIIVLITIFIDLVHKE